MLRQCGLVCSLPFNTPTCMCIFLLYFSTYKVSACQLNTKNQSIGFIIVILLYTWFELVSTTQTTYTPINSRLHIKPAVVSGDHVVQYFILYVLVYMLLFFILSFFVIVLSVLHVTAYEFPLWYCHTFLFYIEWQAFERFILNIEERYDIDTDWILTMFWV